MAHRLRLRRQKTETEPRISDIDDDRWNEVLRRKYQEGMEDGTQIATMRLQETAEQLHSQVEDMRRERDEYRRRALNAEALSETATRRIAVAEQNIELLENELRRVKHAGPLGLLQNKVQHGKRSKSGKGTATSRGRGRRPVSGGIR